MSKYKVLNSVKYVLEERLMVNGIQLKDYKHKYKRCISYQTVHCLCTQVTKETL